ncbi:MAG: MBL fold metallo-hydrolase [Chloroflexi bacterium]|nr:MBL fold metallo-hydrolase [Chloroflexota bacterium]
MLIKQFVVEGLGNSSYLVGSPEDRVAVIIDPQRDVDIYLNVARELGLAITHALETHLHADFVSGSRELAARTGAHIGASAAGNLQFHHLSLKEGDRLKTGKLAIQVLETPGHSPEHLSFLVREEGSKEPAALFSGGALIVGGAARTDLLGHEHTHSLTHQLYHTLHDKLMPLPDETRVYPTHGAGSFCIASEEGEEKKRATTIGQERQHNRLLKAASEEDFIKVALEGLPSYPDYFRRMAAVNRKGPRILGDLPIPPPLPPQRVKGLLDKGAIAVDARPFRDFARGHIRGAYSNPLRDSFATYLGWVVPPEHPLIIVPQSEEKLEAIVRQAIRVGYDDLAGYPEGGMEAWQQAGYPVETVELTTPEEVYQEMQKKAVALLDVREESEWATGHVPGALHIELGELEKRIAEVPADAALAVTCSLGNRSSTAASILKRRGFKDVRNLAGGMTAWKDAKLPLVKAP